MDSFDLNSLYNISDSLSDNELLNLCRSNTRFNNNLCESDEFWRHRYVSKFGQPGVAPSVWKGLYFYPQNVVPIGMSFKDIMGWPIDFFLMGTYSEDLETWEKDREIRGLNKDYYKIENFPVPLEEIKQLQLSKLSIFILTNDGVLYVAGRNLEGELGLGDKLPRDKFLEIPLPPIKKISIGPFHSVILFYTGEFAVAGKNSYSALGISSASSPAFILPDFKNRVKDIITTNTYTAILLDNGDVYYSGALPHRYKVKKFTKLIHRWLMYNQPDEINGIYEVLVIVKYIELSYMYMSKLLRENKLKEYHVVEHDPKTNECKVISMDLDGIKYKTKCGFDPITNQLYDLHQR